MRRHSASLFWTSNVGSATALDRFDQRRPTSTASPPALATKIRRLSISYLTFPWAFTSSQTVIIERGRFLGTPRTQDESSTHRARCGPRAAWICKRPRSSSCGGPTLPKLAARPRSFNGCPLALAVSLLRPRGERPSGGRAAEQRDELAVFHCPVPPVLSTERIPHLSYGRRLLYCGISIGPMTAWVKTEHNPSISC